MSWFDTAGFASLAKSALKEAQKTFDKALDLEAIEEKPSVTDGKETDDSDSFFSAFGLGGGVQAGATDPAPAGGAGAGGAERAAASLWDTLGASLLRDSATADEPATDSRGSAGDSGPEPEPEPVTLPPNGLSGIDAVVASSAVSEGWSEPPSASPGGDVAALRVDSPSPDGFQNSVLVVASPSSDWPPPGETATPESIEVLDGSDQDWEAGWEASGDSTGTLQDADAPAESLHSSNSSCHTLVSADGGAAYSAMVAPTRGKPADSPGGESSSSESFIRLGLGTTPLTSPDAGNLTSPDVELVTSPEAGNITSPDVEVMTSPDVEIIKPPVGGRPTDVSSVCSSDAGNITSPDVEVVTSPEGDVSSPGRGTVAGAVQAVCPGDETGSPASDVDPGHLPRPVSPASVEPADSTNGSLGMVSSAEPLSPGEPVSSEPVSSVEVMSSEPVSSEPASSEPTSSEPVSSVEVVSSEPVSSVEPVSSEPVSSVEVVSSEPVSSVEPVSSTSESIERLPSGAAAAEGRAEARQRPGASDGPPARERSQEPSSGSTDSAGRGLSPHESGHTSADEIETATSSDVEVLASPQAEGRQLAAPVARAARRGGPAAVAADRADTPSSDGSHPPPALAAHHREPGHRRNLSQTSVASSDLDPECDRWPRRLAELQDVLTAREAKMLELSRLNVTLQEDNNNMQSRVELLEAQLARSTSAPGGQQEKLTTERDALHKQLTEARRRCTGLEEAVLERDTAVEELRAEGEKLSRDQLKLNTVIKRLRTKEREQEAAAKKLEEKVTRLTSENSQLTEQLSSLKEADREQSRAHKQLAGQLSRMEREVAEASRQAEDARDAKVALETALQTAHREVSELERRSREHHSEAASQALSAEIQAKQELERTLAEYRSSATREQDDLLAQIEDLRLGLRRAERENARREDGYQAETAELQRRLLDSETRNQQLADSVAMATRPLQRQLETLQAALSTQQHSWERAERALTEKNVELQRQLATVTERERHVSDQYVEASSRQAPLEASLAEMRAERSRTGEQMAALERRLADALAQTDRCRSERVASERQLTAELTEVRAELDSLERQLATERAALLAERARNAALHRQAEERGRQLSQSQSAVESMTSQLSTPRTSPTPSLSRISFSSSLHELDSVFDPATPRALPAAVSLYDSVRAAAGHGGATVVESLTSRLKQRDGEVSQLRAERAELEAGRQQLSAELARVSAELETAADAGRRLQTLTAEFQQLQSTYNALLQMYGEKAEESEELKLDLADVKEMYKQQIDQLTQRAASSSS